nr:MAG TPA: hypothetical protein [Caudoviricetes sp.]
MPATGLILQILELLILKGIGSRKTSAYHPTIKGLALN